MVEEKIGISIDKPITFTRLKGGIYEMSLNPLPDKISTQQHFNKVEELALKYVFDRKSTFPNYLQIIGDLIAIDYPFPNQGRGCNTLAGQLDNMSANNRDCKLPTFLLAYTLSKLYPESNVNILLDRLEPFHPFVKIEVNDQSLLGHFIIDTENGGIVFLTSKDTAKTKSQDTPRLHKIPPTLDGMIKIDEAFIKEVIE